MLATSHPARRHRTGEPMVRLDAFEAMSSHIASALRPDRTPTISAGRIKRRGSSPSRCDSGAADQVASATDPAE